MYSGRQASGPGIKSSRQQMKQSEKDVSTSCETYFHTIQQEAEQSTPLEEEEYIRQWRGGSFNFEVAFLTSHEYSRSNALPCFCLPASKTDCWSTHPRLRVHL